jgi:endopeptidase La
MASVFIKNYRSHRLQKEYSKYSTIVFNTQNHVNKLHTHGMLSLADRNHIMKVLNDILKQMNSIYNSFIYDMKNYFSDNTSEEILSDCEFCYDSAKYIICNDNDEFVQKHYDTTMEINDIYNVIGVPVAKCHSLYKQLNWEPFDEINNRLIIKLEKIGTSTIHDAMLLFVGNQYKYLLNTEERKIFDVYNSLIVPMAVCEQKRSNRNNISLNRISNINDVLMDNSIELIIRIDDDAELNIAGFFRNDDLNVNVRTSQICNNFIYQKKKQVEEYMVNKSNANDSFRKAYIKNLSVCNILSLDKARLLDKIDDDYTKFNEITKLSFMNLMKEFTKDNGDKMNLKELYDIIRVLLLGNDDHANIAGILFGIIKDKKIGSETVANIIYNNLSYLLQIKLKRSSINIRNELEKIKALSIDDVDLKKQVVACSNMPPDVKRCVLEKIEEMKSSNSEYYKQQLYVKTLLNYPWISKEDDHIFAKLSSSSDEDAGKNYLDNFIKSIDSRVYGHKQTKESIRDMIGKWIANPDSSGSSIGLYGPPGVGKTLIAQAIGQSLDIPFVQITLGGQNDGEFLHGHGYTYSGAQPGIIIKKMIEAGSPRCVMYFDELDKATKKHDVNEIQNILVNMTDPKTNSEFTDRFFSEIKFPLKKVLFIFSYNDPMKVDKILRDRLEKINTQPYSVMDKVNIAQKFSINEICQTINFEQKNIALSNNNLKFIIEEYTNEAGVREFKRKLDKIFLKLNIDRIYRRGIFKANKNRKKIKITRNKIIEYLDKPESSIQMIHDFDQVGVINGLYATDNGSGGIIPIQIYNNYTGVSNKFTLKLTGRQGKVMRESVMTAFTSAINFIEETRRKAFIKDNKYGLHIHTPSGSVPKDGPSAGCAFATAFVSRILNKKIKRNIAMTGEIELSRKVTKIGGLQYKLMGAKKAGVELILVSRENEEDVETITKENPELLCDTFDVKLVDSFRDVLKYALCDYDDSYFILNDDE